ncbi:formylglycine-generating enzyme family protein [Planctomycetota bacterium]
MLSCNTRCSCAGTTTRCYWGDDPQQSLVDKYAWRGGYPDGSTRPVGQKLPNPWGLYDMCGNVVEFCQDRYAPYKPGHQVNPLNQDGTHVVGRGGDWFHAHGVDSEKRRKYFLDGGLSFLGFRIVREVELYGGCLLKKRFDQLANNFVL